MPNSPNAGDCLKREGCRLFPTMVSSDQPILAVEPPELAQPQQVGQQAMAGQ
jgi:hypothetical protein